MIFSKAMVEKAFGYAYPFYDKILFVDFNSNTFQPIRVNDKEWETIPKDISFRKWVADFVISDSYKPCSDNNPDQLVDLLDLEACRVRTNVMICNYYKLIDGEYHIVQMELYPAENCTAYLFVRDLTKMQRGIGGFNE